MRKIVIWAVVTLVVIGVGIWGVYKLWPVENPKGGPSSRLGGTQDDLGSAVDYSRYSFDNLRKNYVGVGGTIEIGGPIEEVELRRKNLGYEVDFDTRVFWYESNGKRISGMINYRPWESRVSPVVIMIRGYADKEGYYPGYGTWRVADELAKAGYVTISTDFLGYGQSDQESLDNLEARFEKVENVLDLLVAVKNIPFVDTTEIGFWAHSNGGQITLSVLEIDGGRYPTVLWAPMTNPFPASVLETIEEDSPVKKEIEDFMKYYDSREYAFENYYSWINSSILVIQGDNDPWCQVSWQEEVIENLKSFGKQAELVIMPGAGHNMEGKWEEATKETVLYYREIK